MNYDAYIFDVDGVLIDTTFSFPKAIEVAVAFDSGEDWFTGKEITDLKEMGGFNNDWHTAIAGACWLRFHRDLSFTFFTRKIGDLGSGLSAIRELCPELDTVYEQRITRLAQEAYGGMSACLKLYGFDPKNLQIPGYWQNEKPLIDTTLLDSVFENKGIVTGRDRAEMELAFQILNWRIPEKWLACSDNPEFDKPNPKKLITIIKNLQSSSPLYFGDSRDDQNLIHNYRELTGKPIGYCFIGEENNNHDYNHIFPGVKEFFEYRELNNG